MPASVALEDGSTVQPLLVLVTEAGGAIRANAVGHPDDPGELLEEAIDEAIDQPPPPCPPGIPPASRSTTPACWSCCRRCCHACR